MTKKGLAAAHGLRSPGDPGGAGPRLLFVCRLWPILLLAMLGIIIVTLRLLFLSSPPGAAFGAHAARGA